MKIYQVGGCIRDKLLGRIPKDYDYVVTGATPAEMLELNYVQVGASFPVYLHPVTGDEYALARRERKTGDGYLGFECDTGPDVTVEVDAARRDFTINSIAYDPTTGTYHDPYNGMSDINSKILRHTTSAFAEDPLRVIRLARFAARYPEFTIAPETLRLCRHMVQCGGLDALPTERYWAELHKVFVDSPDQLDRFLRVLLEVGALALCKFFQNTLGDDLCVSDSIWLDMFTRDFGVRLTAVAKQDPDLAIAIFVTLYRTTSNISGARAPNRVLELIANWRLANPQEFAIDSLYDIVSATRSLCEQSPALLDLVVCLRVAGFKSAADNILAATDICASIKAAPYLDLPGREIGLAMKHARQLALADRFQ